VHQSWLIIIQSIHDARSEKHQDMNVRIFIQESMEEIAVNILTLSIPASVLEL